MTARNEGSIRKSSAGRPTVVVCETGTVLILIGPWLEVIAREPAMISAAGINRVIP